MAFNKISFRKDLQGLRAVAISLVVLAHLGFTQFEGGFVGVDVFFVLSGYLITGLLLREFYVTQSIDFMAFYARRLKRLLPSLIFMLVVMMAVGAIFMLPFELISKTKSVLYASTWTSNLYFAFSEVGYFSDMELQDLFLHTWSLALEEQFYLVWPLLIFICLSVFKNSLKSKNQKITLLIILIFVFITSFLLSLYWSYNKPLWAFYLMPSRIWQFSLGAGIFVYFEWKKLTIPDDENNSLYKRIPFQIIGLTLIILSSILLTPDMMFPGWWALIPSIGTALILIRAQHFMGDVLASPIMVWVGDRSYSWYLWHWPIFMLANTLRIGNTLYEAAFLIILSLLAASISYSLVEIPFWKGKFSKLSVNKSIYISLFAMLVATTSISTAKNSQFNKVDHEFSSISGNDVSVIYSQGCDSWTDNFEINPCIFGDKSFNKTVVLMGDSILMQWFSLVKNIFRAPEWRLIVLTKSACPMVDEDYFYDRIKKKFKVCSQWRNKLFDTLSEIKPDVIIVGNSAAYPFSNKQWKEGSERIFERLSAVSNNTLVVLGTPKLTFSGPSCLKRIEKKIELRDQCSEVNFDPKIAEVKALLQSASQKLDNVKLLDMNEFVCPNSTCNAMTNDGIIVFRDTEHLSDAFVQSLISDGKKKIDSLGLKLNK